MEQQRKTLMDEETRITWMWQAFIQESDRPNLQEFQRRVAAEFSCNLQEAADKTSHLLLTE